MQQLWALQCDWDQRVPVEVLNAWRLYHSLLPDLERISIPRWIQHGHHSLQYELHGFSDASTKAYAAVVYFRVVSEDGTVNVMLLTAKSKVAPFKTVSVPRLELSAALLLTRLIHFILTSLVFKDIPLYYWTDSTITLAWIRRPSAQWKTFVANRVAEIQTLLPTAFWRHVPTNKNPADCASQGISPAELASATL
ncbi:PREDICTED: uncharacterized protein LOC105448567 [Wasmannia auropunctata]|uniref:uncharacterized protein LOC105448567 n=1 Tax=Wasmannia auropunctata TaxID=64793 RepID=UPI0005EF5949|nr:PREDICTED: uncharacterized protein LOC105448567 [Wasmannia auropunctata]